MFDRMKKNGQIKTLEAQVSVRLANIKALQQEFGVRMYPLLVAGEDGSITPIYEEFRQKIEALQQEVHLKEAEIKSLQA